MIPILYNADETSFTTNGLGGLSDAISCLVYEDRNGMYEVEMTYPVNGEHYKEMANGMIIYCTPSYQATPQPFRIYEITEYLDGTAEIKAEHISYDLNYIPVEPFEETTVGGALAKIKSKSMETNPFTFTTDISSRTIDYIQNAPNTARSCLGGSDYSILDNLIEDGIGEFEWDKFTVKLWENRGSDNGVCIRYAKNLTDLKRIINSVDLVSGCLAVWSNSDSTSILYGDIQYNSVSLPYARTIIFDVSRYFNDPPTRQQLNTAAQEYVDLMPLGPKANLKVSFVDISSVEEYENIRNLEQIKLCDTVTVVTKIDY